MRSVIVFGPNLPRSLQDKGYFHVHAEGCAHCAKLAHHEQWTMQASCREDIVRDLYSNHMAESGEENPDWRDWDDLYVAPCLRGKEWK